MVTASTSPDKAQKALNMLIEEMFPSHKLQRQEAIDKALEIMESEQKRVYQVKKTEVGKNKIGRKIGKALKKRR